MTLQEDNTLEVLDVSGFSEISEILIDELNETNKSIDSDIVPELTLEELDTDNSLICSDLDESIISSELESFIESIGDMLSKSQYILYSLAGEKMYLNKDDVVYESDKLGNRQYYLISDNTPLFQNLEMVKQYFHKEI